MQQRPSEKAERYLTFLLTYLPRLQSTALELDRDTRFEWRGAVLMQALRTAADRNGLFMEFGVWKGGSINVCAKHYPQMNFFGFDSFEGFPDDGRDDWQQDFRVDGLPTVPGNVTLVKGWFSATLPQFLSAHKGEPVAFLNIDCDIYSSTHDVFSNLVEHKLLVPGVVISFDELINYNSYIENEMLALFEMLEKTGLGIEWVCCHQKVMLVTESLSHLENGSYPSWQDQLTSGQRQQAALKLVPGGIDYSILDLHHVRKYVKSKASLVDRLISRSRQQD